MGEQKLYQVRHIKALRRERNITLDLLKRAVDQLYKVKGYLSWDQRKPINDLLDEIEEENIL